MSRIGGIVLVLVVFAFLAGFSVQEIAGGMGNATEAFFSGVAAFFGAFSNNGGAVG